MRSGGSLAVFVATTVFFYACKDMPAKNHGPIVLGDSSTIVTEKDPSKLQDLVADLKPEIPSNAEKADTPVAEKTPAKPATADTPKKGRTVIAPAQIAAPAGPGLSAEFSEVTLFIQNIAAKQAGNPNLLHANGAVYTLVSGNITGNILKLTGNVTKVSQRYQSVVILKNGATTLPLESLTTTTSWEPLTGGNGMYRITGLDAQSLEYPETNNNGIKNAVTKAAQRRRISRSKIQELVSSVRNLRSANQKPLTVTIRSVMWKIDGKDTKGKPFSKQIRIDVPM